MLSNVVANKAQLLQKSSRAFGSNPGIMARVLNTVDRNTTAYTVAKQDPTVPLKGHKPIEAQDKAAEYHVTKLSNGFTVLTESQTFPSGVHMGFMLNVGTRDETNETSGSLLALKNTYLKTLKHTNETINYGMIQMSGGDLTMDYDQEQTFFRGNCIEYDVIDMFQMLVDVALEPRSVLAANVAKSKNRKTHELNAHLSKFDPWMNNTELLLRTAYGYNTLGMPQAGLESNVDNIDARVLQKFVMDNVTPNKSLIVASGVQNHKEFVDLVKERIGELYPVPEHLHARKASEYLGGEYRTWSESPNTNIVLAFESASWTDSDTAAYHVMNQLLGSGVAFGENSRSRAGDVLGKYNFVENVEGVCASFTDSGLFGIQIQGSSSHAQELMDVALGELNALRNGVSDEELQRAKTNLKFNVLTSVERQGDRLEEMARNFTTFGDLTFHKHCDAIDAVTSEQVSQAATRALAGKPTLVVTGGAINLVPSTSDVQRQLN